MAGREKWETGRDGGRLDGAGVCVCLCVCTIIRDDHDPECYCFHLSSPVPR